MKPKRKRKPAAKAPSPIPQPEALQAHTSEGDDLVLRLLASAMGLPRVCVFKTCRRHKRCFGPDIVCARHHHGLIRGRIDRAIKLIAAPKR